VERVPVRWSRVERDPRERARKPRGVEPQKRRAGAIPAGVVLPWLAVLLLAASPVRAAGLEGLLLGLNGILTAPADPVSHVVVPLEDFAELPAHQVTGRLLGIVSGTLLATYRVVAGAFDVALTPLWVVPTLSPEPRFRILPLLEDERQE
jgi:hypothetical protein